LVPGCSGECTIHIYIPGLVPRAKLEQQASADLQHVHTGIRRTRNHAEELFIELIGKQPIFDYDFA
jgi:hypothetical protein